MTGFLQREKWLRWDFFDNGCNIQCLIDYFHLCLLTDLLTSKETDLHLDIFSFFGPLTAFFMATALFSKLRLSGYEHTPRLNYVTSSHSITKKAINQSVTPPHLRIPFMYVLNRYTDLPNIIVNYWFLLVKHFINV